jgi:hypothetical protein
MLNHLWSAFHMAFAMFWEIFWPLILGFTLSGAVQAVVSKGEMSRMLPDDSPKSITKACALGAASSSCSYAAVALARSIFRKGANFTAAMVFELASTNLVAELAIIMIVLLGWQFALAEFIGAPVMVIILVILFRKFFSGQLLTKAREQADRGVQGRMEGHADMDMSVTEGSIPARTFSAKGITAISHYFVMDWASVWLDIVGGLLLAGALAAWVPKAFWAGFFLSSHPTLAKLWGPLIGPVVAVISFVCSVGNVPLAAVLWNSGISFGGVIAFIFADLIVIPVLDIYRKYYGMKIMVFILTTFYASMVGGALVIEFLFQGLGLIPGQRKARVVEAAITWNYTTILNIIFLAIAAALLYRFFRTGGPEMLRMMNKPSHSEQHQMVRDPVCKMQLNPQHAAGQSDHKGQTYYFCSAQCKEEFDRDPARYAVK